ncbi:GTP pyrophosphokinase, partial [Streptomyces sp. WI03-5b]|nr:GTP pyrophosphokinase [Streptomyces sp. WI03-5b]
MPDEAQPVAAPQPERPAAASATPGETQHDGPGASGSAGEHTQGPAKAPAPESPGTPAAPATAAKPTPPPGTKAAPSSATKPAPQEKPASAPAAQKPP